MVGSPRTGAWPPCLAGVHAFVVGAAAVAIAALGACGEPGGGSAATATAAATAPDRAATTPPPASTAPDDPSGATTTSPPSTDQPDPPIPGPAALPPGDDTTVTRVVDGDTIVVAGDARVRLIGIDTPESVDPRQGVQCFGREASAFTGRLLPAGTAVRLVYDVERADRFGRTLAYVYRRDDGAFVNARLVADGYAQVATYPPNVAHADAFVALQRVAREAGRGLWSACPDGAGPAAPAPPGAGTDGCDPAYPDVCIPSPPPDLDCADVDERRFRVVAPDPHRFDGDGDGFGCES